MRKFLRLLFEITIILILFVNCNNSTNKQSDISYLSFKDSININVIKASIHSKSLILNDSVVLYKTSRLIFENHYPKWLFEKTKNKELFNNIYIYKPDISEIEVPYKLIKYKKSNIFQLIKKTDTLYFDFEDFEELDY